MGHRTCVNTAVRRSTSCFALNSLHVRTLMSTHVQTPFLGTPLVPLYYVGVDFWWLLCPVRG